MPEPSSADTDAHLIEESRKLTEEFKRLREKMSALDHKIERLRASEVDRSDGPEPE